MIYNDYNHYKRAEVEQSQKMGYILEVIRRKSRGHLNKSWTSMLSKDLRSVNLVTIWDKD